MRMPRVYRKQRRSRSSGTCAHRDSVHRNHQEIRDIVRGYQLEFGQECGEDIRPEISEQFECLSTCTGEGDGENHSASHQMTRKTLSPSGCWGEAMDRWVHFNMVLNTRSSSQQKATVVAIPGRLSRFPKQCGPRVSWIHWEWLDGHLTLNCLPAFAGQLHERRWCRWVHPGPDWRYVKPERPCSDKQMFAQMYRKI